MTTAQINTAIAIESLKMTAMTNEEIRHNWMLWSVRAGEVSTEYTMGMSMMYTREFFARGLNVAYCNANRKSTKRAK